MSMDLSGLTRAQLEAALRAAYKSGGTEEKKAERRGPTQTSTTSALFANLDTNLGQPSTKLHVT
jgi:hypothetical protein